MIVFFIVILLTIAFILYKSYKEPLSGYPSEYVQEQAGEIQHLYDKIQQLTLTESLIDSLQTDNDTTTDYINQLQANMPTSIEKNAY
jgi:hypothetical protein